jgi:hypothetical protein
MAATWRRIYDGREYVCWKEAGKQRRQLAHRWLWEQANGPIPDGHEIHHRDHNPLNNDLSNLMCVTAEWHDDHHQRLREQHMWIDGVEHRRCQRCGTYKPTFDFTIRRAGTFHGYCRPCALEYRREWVARNREEFNAKRRAKRAAGFNY